MPGTGLDVFDETLQKSNLLLKDIEETYGWEDRHHQAYAGLRAVLHTLRDRLTPDEAANFASQLPLLIKGVFYDQWVPSATPREYDDREFMAEVRRQLPFEPEGGEAQLVAIVLTALMQYVSPGEMKDAMAMLPRPLVARLREA